MADIIIINKMLPKFEKSLGSHVLGGFSGRQFQVYEAIDLGYVPIIQLPKSLSVALSPDSI